MRLMEERLKKKMMLILKELEKMLDDSLKSETKESLTEWLLSMREMEDEDPEIAACINEHFWEILCDNASEPNQTKMKTIDENTQKLINEAAGDFADKHGFRTPYDGSNKFYDKVDLRASKDGFLEGANFVLTELLSENKKADQLLAASKSLLFILTGMGSCSTGIKTYADAENELIKAIENYEKE